MTMMLDVLDSIGKLIGNTRVHKLQFAGNLYVKFEFQNIFGSVKDRPAFYILKKAIEAGLIDQDTIVIESTSGNFGIALAHICKALQIRFIPVIDPNISKAKEKLLELISYKIIKVTEKDHTGGYLLTRIRTVQNFLKRTPNSYNPNQYDNPDNYLSYFHTLGKEICQQFERLDYVFISVSSCGTVIGLSRKLKEQYPALRVVAVDIEGSMIFSDVPKVRKISGIGASKRSSLLDMGSIDEVVILSQDEIVAACYELLNKHSLFLGASSGAAYAGAKRILEKYGNAATQSLFISPDHGNAYLDNIYSQEWLNGNVFLKERIDEIFE
jgi:N-(2-amino-2-carboxyethyl)-L-glutamate synthase